MSILVNKNTRLLVQGITGREGSFHTTQMIDYGTNVVGGVTPGKGGQWFSTDDKKVPVFDTVKEAVQATGANASLIFVPARFAVDAIYEAADADVELIICLTEHIPVLDMIAARAYLDTLNVRLVGPNCPGLLTPGEAKVGIIPGAIAIPGTKLSIGQSTCVGIGGDPISGTSFIDVLALFEEDPDTEQIVMIGEIGGNAEEQAAAYIAQHITKPVTSFIAGRTAPPGKRMGNAGAIVEGKSGTAESKVEALRAAGVRVADNPDDIAKIVASRQ